MIGKFPCCPLARTDLTGNSILKPEVGDLTYYAPWGNLAIFYRDFGYAKGLVKLGRIDSGLELLSGADGLPLRVERAEPPVT